MKIIYIFSRFRRIRLLTDIIFNKRRRLTNV